jgi:hypothetical protein
MPPEGDDDGQDLYHVFSVRGGAWFTLRLRKRLAQMLSTAPRFLDISDVGVVVDREVGESRTDILDDEESADLDAVVDSSRKFECARPRHLCTAELSHVAVEDACVDTSTGALYRSGDVVLQSIVGPMHPDRFRVSWRQNFRRREVETRPIVPLLGNRSGGVNYYHWMLDVLPRAAVLDSVASVEGLTLVAPSDRRAFVDESIDRVADKYGVRDVTYVGSGHLMFCQTIYLSTYPLGDFRYLHASGSIEWLRGLFDVGERTSRIRKRRIYIRRSSHIDRHISNETAVRSVLVNLGFETVEPDRLSVVEQARLFAEASIIVSTHGAGLSNTVFSADADVLELVAPGLVAPYYAYLSAAAGNRYKPVWGINDGKHGVKVDLAQLEVAVIRAIERT